MISTLGLAMRTQKNVMSLQERLSNVEQQVSTQKKSDTYSGMSGAVRESVDMRTQYKKVDTYLSNIARLKVDVGQMEQPLLEIGSLTNEMRDDLLAQQNGTAPNMDEMRASTAAALSRLTSALNINLSGRYSFSGTAIDKPPMGDSSSLQTQVQSIMSGYGDATDATAKFDAAVAYVQANWGDFYQGDTGASKLSGIVEEGEAFSFGVRADDPAFQKLYATMFVMNSVEYSADNPAGYDAIRTKAIDALGEGFSGVNAMTGEWGRASTRLDQLGERYADQQVLLNTRIGELEDVDLAAKSVELSNLKSQMETSYSLISMLREMSLVNYL